MGYIGNVNDAKDILEKLYKLDSPENQSLANSLKPPQRLL